MTEHLTPAHYFDLLRFAKRQTRRAAEAEDLLHEALIVALKAKRFPTLVIAPGSAVSFASSPRCRRARPLVVFGASDRRPGRKRRARRRRAIL